VTLWFTDLISVAVGADELVRNTDRPNELKADGGRSLEQLRAAIEHVEDTRQRFQLNVSEELACEALAYQLERAVGS
jgi:DNA polymerase-3 subunit delta'